MGGLDLVLDGQAVAVPAGHVGCIEARQVLGLDDDVLENLVDGVTDMDAAVGIGRAIVQDEQGRPRTGFAQALVQVHVLPLGNAPGSCFGSMPRMGKSVSGRFSVCL